MNIDDVAAFVDGLRGVTIGTKHGHRTWMVGERGFAWERRFSKADLARFGEEPPPAGDILAVMVDDLDAKDALLAIAPPGFFTIPHFNGFPAVLVQLEAARVRDVKAVLRTAYKAAVAKAGGSARKPRPLTPVAAPSRSAARAATRARRPRG